MGACSEINQVAGLDLNLTDNEIEAVKLAKDALSQENYEQSIKKANEENAKLTNTPVENFFEGATYEAYLVTRVTLPEVSYELAKAQGIFASELTYDNYCSVSLSLVSQTKFKEMMAIDFDKEILFDDLDREHFKEGIRNSNVEIYRYAYGTYLAKSVQYLTPEGSPF